MSEQPLRILHFVGTLMAAGLETSVVNYFKNMDHEKVIYDFCVIGSSTENFYEQYLIDQGSRIFWLPEGNKFNKRIFKKKLCDILTTYNYDIVHINCGYFLKLVISKIAKKCKVKTVITHSHDMGDYSRDKFKILRKMVEPLFKHRINKVCDYKFACSRVVGEHVYDNFTIIHNAIDLEAFKFSLEARNTVRNMLKIDESKLVVGHIGRLAYPKNQLFLLKLIPYIKSITSDFVIILVGDGEDRLMLQDYIKSNALEDYVIFVGNVGGRVKDYYSAFDVFVLPSFNEGLSLVSIEAQANGVPVIASNTISQEHKVAKNFIFKTIEEEDKNYNDWAQSIVRLRGDRSENIALLSECGYNIKLEAQKLQDFYLNIANR